MQFESEELEGHGLRIVYISQNISSREAIDTCAVWDMA
jgi:hypothetical protein